MRVGGLLASLALLAACSSAHPVAAPPAPSASATSASATPSASAAPAVSPAAAPTYGWYLSIGDSLAFGFQQARAEAQQDAHAYDPAAFDTGFADVVEARLKQLFPGIVSENLGCAGETTVTYAAGGCPGQPDLLHVPYTGAQAAAAHSFLASRTGPGLVTVALGSNDALDAVEDCTDFSASCVLPKLPAVLTSLRTGLAAELKAVTTDAPGATVLVLLDYNAFVTVSDQSSLAVDLLDGTIAAAAADAGVKTVDPRPAFSAGDAKAMSCTLTLFCGGEQDIHPSDAGYALLGKLFLAAAGVT